MRNHEKSCAECGGEASPRHFYKKSKLNQQSEKCVFIVCLSRGLL